MSRQGDHLSELSYLTLRSLDGDISATEFDRLQEMLEDSDEARYTYHKLLNIYVGICDPENLLTMKSNRQEGFGNPILIEAIAKMDQKPTTKSSDPDSIDQVRQRAERQLQQFLAKQERQRQVESAEMKRISFNPMPYLQHGVRRLETAVRLTTKGIVGVAAVLGVFLCVIATWQYVQSHRILATLDKTLHAQWEQAPESNDLHPGWLHLERGYASLVMEEGTRVLLQAPCSLELLSENRIHLAQGSVSAEVPERAQGFTIETPASKIVDFGTEFGALVRHEKDVEIHVFKGHVGVGAKTSSKSSDLEDLRTSQAAVVNSKNKVQIHELSKRTRLFEQTMPEGERYGIPGVRIDLADIIGGGNGFGTGLIGYGIDIISGRIAEFDFTVTPIRAGAYHMLPELRFIDGYFVPDGGTTGRITVSSSGHEFDRCPSTSGRCHRDPINGAVFGWKLSTSEPGGHPGQLQGQLYNSQAFPSIAMNANIGISFDLEHLRQSLVPCAITRFTAICGISETATTYIKNYEKEISKPVSVDFWVLVDGEKRFHRSLMAVPADVDFVDIPLPPDARFLTLMTTDSQGQMDFCWGMFAQPTLELSRP